MGVSTDLNSNLWFMTKNRAAELAGAGLAEASVGIEGPEPVHDALLGVPGALARLFAGVKMLQGAGIVVDGSMYVTPANRPHVRATIEVAVRLGLGSFTVTRMLPVGHGLRYVGPRLPEEERADLHEELADARAGKYGIPVRCVGLLGAPGSADCGQGNALIGIRADGTLTPCVLSRDALAGVPHPQDAGLAIAVRSLQTALKRTIPMYCYGGPG
jgi:MoaA/NifB/PqqE/SkfB family radical SAM enzyme